MEHFFFNFQNKHRLFSITSIFTVRRTRFLFQATISFATTEGQRYIITKQISIVRSAWVSNSTATESARIPVEAISIINPNLFVRIAVPKTFINMNKKLKIETGQQPPKKQPVFSSNSEILTCIIDIYDGQLD